jgi:hypothetical protein
MDDAAACPEVDAQLLDREERLPIHVRAALDRAPRGGRRL